MQVILSVPVPSLMVMSPLARAYCIISSIMNDVSPFSFYFFPDAPSLFDFYAMLSFFSFSPLDPYLAMSSPFSPGLNVFVGLMMPFFGPLARLFLTNLTAYSLVKQSQIPSQATIMKSMSALIVTSLTSGNEVTKCFLHSAMSFTMSLTGGSSFFSSSFFLLFLVDLLFSSSCSLLGYLYSQSPMALETAITP
jgi:hypothetical protein